ncbi:MAG TPA: hypothetical protein PK191_02295 [Niabella sp.]|nr:hypothetical protein [Niabella sp.]HOZ95838.1 hypothetical protein [Niabella sp.]HQW13692.1 hypothetical protein [Niabella sp.]HQX19086.1 hypothetical protein [Niabella sp.]HQX42794.1 hypothetical protein [Niabella sp.]
MKKAFLVLFICASGFVSCNSNNNEENAGSIVDSATTTQPATVSPAGVPADSVVNLDSATDSPEDTAIH